MPQPSIAYAVGRVRAAAQKPLGEAQLQRLISASGYPEAMQLLTEMGWQDSGELGIERLSTTRLEQICSLLREISPEPNLTDSFLLRHDAQNLKALLKARVLQTAPEGLSDCGTMSVDMLKHAVTEHRYGKLPPVFEKTMNALEKELAIKVDPMVIDVRLDQALYSEIEQRMRSVKSKAAKQYFEAYVDFHNVLAYLRLMNMNRAESEFSNILLPGGKVTAGKWNAILKKPELLRGAFKAYGIPYQDALTKAQMEAMLLPAIEKVSDDYLLDIFRPYRNEPYAVEVLLGWLLSHEREASAVRLIMAGKQNDFPEEVIRERLREAYGR